MTQKRDRDGEERIQVRVSKDQKRVWTKAAELQGLDVSSLTRRLMTIEVDRMRAEGKKL